MAKKLLISDINQNRVNELSSIFNSENELKIAELYKKHREPFFRYIFSMSSLDEFAVSQIYHDSFMVLHKNIVTKKLTTLTCSLSTYLNAIGEKVMLNYIKNNKQKYDSFEPINNLPEIENDIETENKTRVEEIIYQTVSEMQEPCNKILMLHYWERKKMKEIANLVGFVGEDSVKTKKYRCMQVLKTVLTRQLKEEDLI